MYRIVDRGEYIAALSVQPSENQKANNREELIVAAAGRSARGMGTRAAIIDASPIPYYTPHLFWAENGAADAAHTIHDHLSGGPQWQG
ncbi:MAG: hypothetical protein AMS17_20555 [Spirochaetes bacterium DG_61]|nr:MAG: hypothetical protein AMS17_20555 [Spirochaetes bacterium DG_61]